MLFDMKCPNCGATMQFDDTREVMFCQSCGGRVANIDQNININKQVNVSGRVVHVRDRSNDPNLIITYQTANPDIKMVSRIVSTGAVGIYTNGKTLSYHLNPGQHTIILKIGIKNYSREIYVPADNTPVRIYATYYKRANISIEQPEVPMMQPVVAQPVQQPVQQPVYRPVAQQPVYAPVPAPAAAPVQQRAVVNKPKKESKVGAVIGWIISSIMFFWFLLLFVLYIPPYRASSLWITVITQIILALHIMILNPSLVKLLPDVSILKWVKRHRIPAALILSGVWFVSVMIISITFSDEITKAHFEHNLDSQMIVQILERWKTDGVVDYPDVRDFERDLINGEDLKGKIVTFEVTESRAYTEYGSGYVITPGKNIILISLDDPKVKKGEKVTVLVTGVSIVVGGKGGYNLTYVLLDKK